MLDPRIEAASDFLMDDGRLLSRTELATRLLRHPVQAVRVMALVRRLPTVVMPISASPQGRGLRGALSVRRISGHRRFGLCYLPLGGDDYLAGRSRQALRTNLRRATDEGSIVLELPPGEERQRRFDEVLAPGHDDQARNHWLQTIAGDLDPRCFAAVAADGVTLAVAATTVDGPWAHQFLFLRNPTRSDASTSRYLLQYAVVKNLAATGVEHLLTDSAILVTQGVRYFEHLMGFQPVNLRLVDAR